MNLTLKTITSLLVLVFISGTSIFAQDSNPVRFGIKGGVNFSNLYAKDAENSKMRTGFNVGLFAKLPLTNHIAVQPELYYTTKGAEITYNNIFVDGTAGFHLNYIELPLLIVGNITENFNVHAGPYAAFLINGKVKNELLL
ncbi:MAG: porin family protein, partial [Bacteroidota bacterium]